MKPNTSSPLAMIIAAAGILVSADAASQAMEVVTVEAMREIVVGRTSATGATIRELSIRSRVSYADLNLTKADDVATLQTRVKDTARSTCNEIEVEVAAEGSTIARCIQAAVADAQKQIDTAVAAAKAAAK